MKKKPAATKTEPSAVAAENLFTRLVAIIVLLQIAGFFLPRHLVWGFSFWQELSRSLAAGSLALALFLILTPLGKVLGAAWARMLGGIGKFFTRLPRPITTSFAAAILFTLFYVLRSRALVYGDGYIVVESFTNLEVKVQLSTYFMKPLVVIWHRFWFGMLSKFLDLPPESIVSVVTAVAGVLAVGAIWRIAKTLRSDRLGQSLILFGALTSGVVILFFGYVENYTWATALALWSLAFTLKHLKSRKGGQAAILLALVALGFHLFTLPFLVIAILALLNRTGGKQFAPLGLQAIKFNLGLVALSVAAVLLFQLSGSNKYFVPLWPTDSIPYAAFSPAHLLDVLNELVLVAPLAIVALLMTLIMKGRRQNPITIQEQVLASLALLAFLLSFWINPDLGAPRDWDLLGFYGIPLSLWAICRLARLSVAKQLQPSQLLAVTLVAVICIAPNLYEKNNLKLAAERLDTILWQDAHYQPDYAQAERCLPWGFTLAYNVDDWDSCLKYFHRRREADSTSFGAWYNVGNVHLKRNQLDTAFVYLRKALEIDPNHATANSRMVEAASKLGYADLVRHHATLAAKFGKNDLLPILQGIAVGSQRVGQDQEALNYFRMAFALSRGDCIDAINIAIMFGYLGQHDSCYYYATRGLAQQCNLEAKFNGLIELFNSSLALGKLDEAKRTLDQFARLYPNEEELTTMREKYQKAAESR
jgi:tetratricopeptide (TPR) repeat protein